MKRYSEYKDSGVKWIGEIPRHWEISHIKHHSQFINGYAFDSKIFNNNNKGVKVIRIGNIDGTLNYDTCIFASIESNLIRQFKTCKNDILIAMSGATIGKSCKVSEDDEAYINQRVGIIRCQCFSYMHYYIQAPLFRIFIDINNAGCAQPNISSSTIGNMLFPIPPLNEQEAIVTYLDSKVAKIDEYISIAEKKIAALEELKQTIIAEAVARGIHKDVPMKDSGVKWIGMIPEHWDLKRAQNIVESRKAGAWGEDSRNDERDRVCLRIADFDYSICRFKRTGDYTIRNYKQEQRSSLYLNKGDILIEKSGGGEKTPVGRAILYDLDFYQPLYANFMEKITLREFASSSFYVYLLRTFYAKGCVWKYIKQTTGLQNLDLRTMLGSETFPVPPLSEQQEIVTYIEAKVANINQLCQAERSQIEKLKEYKQRLISDVVTGKVKVTND